MKTRIRIIAPIGLIILIVFGILFYLITTAKEQETSTIIVLKSQGQINTTPGTEVPIDILCFAGKSNSLFTNGDQLVSILTDNSNLEVTDFTIEAGTQYKSMRLYAISLTVKASQLGKQTIKDVVLKDDTGNAKSYYVGEIDISVEEPWTEDNLDISGHTAGADLSETYECSLINKTTQPCVVKRVDFGSLTPYLKGLSIYIDENQIDYNTDIILKTGDKLTVKAEFKTDAGKDVYYVSPKIVYEMENDKTELQYSLPHALLGIPVAENRVKEIYEKYFQK